MRYKSMSPFYEDSFLAKVMEVFSLPINKMIVTWNQMIPKYWFLEDLEFSTLNDQITDIVFLQYSKFIEHGIQSIAC